MCRAKRVGLGKQPVQAQAVKGPFLDKAKKRQKILTIDIGRVCPGGVHQKTQLGVTMVPIDVGQAAVTQKLFTRFAWCLSRRCFRNLYNIRVPRWC